MLFGEWVLLIAFMARQLAVDFLEASTESLKNRHKNYVTCNRGQESRSYLL